MVSVGPRLSYEELADLVVAQAKRVARLEAEVSELRRQVGQNSRNSSIAEAGGLACSHTRHAVTSMRSRCEGTMA